MTITAKQREILDIISKAGTDLSPSEIGEAYGAPASNKSAWAVKGLAPLVENKFVSRKELSKKVRAETGTNKRVVYRLLSKGQKYLEKYAA